MPVLKPEEYDISYFDGSKTSLKHNAGFAKYKRWHRFDGENSLGEYWKDRAANYINHLAISGKKVLEIGCAKGFLVKDLRDVRVDAYGIDISQYAIDNCEDGMSPYLSVADGRDLSSYSRNEFDVVISLRFLECLTDAELTQFASDCSRITKKQVYVNSSDRVNQNFYIYRTSDQLLTYPFPKGTVFAWYNDETNFITK